jgi:hypothetical protein
MSNAREARNHLRTPIGDLVTVFAMVETRNRELDEQMSENLNSCYWIIAALNDHILVEASETIEEARMQALLLRNQLVTITEMTDPEEQRRDLDRAIKAAESITVFLNSACPPLPTGLAGYLGANISKVRQPTAEEGGEARPD